MIQLKKIKIGTNFDTCYIGENRIDQRFSFESGIIACSASCPDLAVYIAYNEEEINLERIKEIIEEMGFPITSVTEIK